MKLIEKVGTGYQRIQDYFKEENLPIPEIRTISGGMMITVFAASAVDHAVSNNDVIDNNVTDNVTDITDNVADVTDITDVTDNRDSLILNLITGNSKISANELAKNLNVTKRTIMRNLEKLKNEGVLTREGSNKGGYWKVRDAK
jgi:ATP-dependent DNA helicase RecG